MFNAYSYDKLEKLKKKEIKDKLLKEKEDKNHKCKCRI